MKSTLGHITLFFLLGSERYEFDKKRTGTHYVEPVFLNPVESVGHVVHSGPFEALNVDALFFMHGWARFGFYKKRVGTHYAKVIFLH
jgi:hypothetical protein